jgi:hypothetical protein
MVLYVVLIAYVEFLGFLIKLDLPPWIHNEFGFCFFFIGRIKDVLFSFLNLIPISLKCNIMDYDSLPNTKWQQVACSVVWYLLLIAHDIEWRRLLIL